MRLANKNTIQPQRFMRLVIWAISLLVLFTQAVPALALTQMDREAVQNGWVHWLPGDVVACSGAGGEGTTSLTGSDAAQQAFNYFVSKGLAPFQAAGVLGNMQAESGVQPERLQNTASGVVTPYNAVDPNGGLGWGLVQWTPPGKFILPTVGAGKDPGSLAVQLDFLWADIFTPGGGSQAAGDAVKAATNVDDAANAFLTKFERPRGVDDPTKLPGIEAVRDPLAEAMLAQYGNGAPSGTSTGNSSGCPTSTNPGNGVGCPAGNSSGNTGGSYCNPLRDVQNLTPSRIDQGNDYNGTGPVYALGNGVIVHATNCTTNWPGDNQGRSTCATWISYQLSDGPAKGNFVFIAEDCNNGPGNPPLAVHDGDTVTATTVLCTMYDGPTAIEMGWAQPGATEQAMAHDYYAEKMATEFGENFQQLLLSFNPAPPADHLDTSGGYIDTAHPLPTGWPTW